MRRKKDKKRLTLLIFTADPAASENFRVPARLIVPAPSTVYRAQVVRHGRVKATALKWEYVDN